MSLGHEGGVGSGRQGAGGGDGGVVYFCKQ